jgi:hypothetical protein
METCWGGALMKALNKILLVIVVWPCQTTAQGKPSSAICISIPNVQLETSASPVQSIRIHFHTGIGSELVARQVCVIDIVLLGGSFVMGKGYRRGGNGNGN